MQVHYSKLIQNISSCFLIQLMVPQLPPLCFLLEQFPDNSNRTSSNLSKSKEMVILKISPKSANLSTLLLTSFAFNSLLSQTILKPIAIFLSTSSASATSTVSHRHNFLNIHSWPFLFNRSAGRGNELLFLSPSQCLRFLLLIHSIHEEVKQPWWHFTLLPHYNIYTRNQSLIYHSSHFDSEPTVLIELLNITYNSFPPPHTSEDLSKNPYYPIYHEFSQVTK